VVEVVELAAIVVEVEVEITVVMEEGVVLRKGSLVLAPSEEKSTVVLVPPFGTKFTPTISSINRTVVVARLVRDLSGQRPITTTWSVRRTSIDYRTLQLVTWAFELKEAGPARLVWASGKRKDQNRPRVECTSAAGPCRPAPADNSAMATGETRPPAAMMTPAG
jgi:hypothetical protein